MRTLALAMSLLISAGALSQVAVKASTLYTMAGPPVRDAVVVVTDGKIVAAGPADQVAIPPGHRVLEASVVTPGLIDARCTVGVSGIANQRQDQDQLETSAPVQPELRAVDAYNPLDPLVAYVRGFGVTTINTGHAPGELVSGQTAIFKTRGETVEAAMVLEEGFIAATLGGDANRPGGAPGTRAKSIAMLREQFIRAEEYRRKRQQPAKDGDEKDEPARDLRMEALLRVLDGKVPLAVTAHRAHDIQAALRLANEFDVRIVLDGASEAYLLVDEIRAAHAAVVVHATMARAWGELENKSMTTAAVLQRAGIPVAIQGGFEDYVPKARVVLFEAGVAAGQGGMGLEGALRTITIDAASILGIQERVGTIEPGKDGDLALFDGDPFEYTTKCVGVVIEGEVVSDQSR